MVVMILERVPDSLRGHLTRWLIEPKAGVFVGKISAMVRDLLWDKVVKHKRTGGCIQLYSAPNEQGFCVRSAGDTTRSLINLDGLTLVLKKKNE